jgi:hypothetical protein
MAKYRLLCAHELEIQDGTQRLHLMGDRDPQIGEGNGTIVGDGTPYRVRWPTLEMEPLDDEARAMITREQDRLQVNQATMNPIEDLPISADEYETRYIPGMPHHQRSAPKPDGAPVRNPPAAEVSEAPRPPPRPALAARPQPQAGPRR